MLQKSSETLGSGHSPETQVQTEQLFKWDCFKCGIQNASALFLTFSDRCIAFPKARKHNSGKSEASAVELRGSVFAVAHCSSHDNPGRVFFELVMALDEGYLHFSFF